MAASITKLQDRAAAVAALLDDLSKVEDRSEAQVAEVEKLTAEATELESRLAQEKAIADKIASLRGQVAAVAKPVAVETPEVRAPRKAARHDRYKVFASTDDAEVCGRWIRGYLLGRTEDRNWYERNVEERALSSDDNAKGGVFIPETFASTVIRLVDEFSAIPQQANVVPMSGNTLYIPRRTGGNTAHFVSDNTETPASDMATDNVLLSTKDCRVGTRVPNSLIENSVVDLASLVAKEFALALSRKIDDAGFAGDGTSTHGGIRGLQYLFEAQGATTTPTATTANIRLGAATLSGQTIDDFAATVSKIRTYARPGACWYVTPQVWSTTMLPLGMARGGVSAAELAGGMTEAQFMGYPVKFNNSMRTVQGDQYSVVALFGDMKLSTHYGVRQAIQVRASTDRYIEFDQTYFQALCRFDIVTSDMGSATEAGPMAALVRG